jgi:type IX secretion system PorP/SprF family membrane protein
MMKLVRNIIFCLLAVNYCSAQQLPHYSLYMFNDAVINPAVCGTKGYDRVHLSSTSQWVGFEGAPKTQFLSYTKGQGERMGLGAVVFNDITGPISRTGLQLSYAYNIDVSPTYKLSFGLAGSMFEYIFDGDKAVLYDNTLDPAAPGGVEKAIVQDATFGTYLYNGNYYIGISLPQLIQSKIKLESDKNNLSRHYFITSGYNFDVNDKLDLEPSVMLKSTDASPFHYDINLRAIYNKQVWGGISYRNQDAVVVMLGMDYNNYSFGYSFDKTLSDINTYTVGSHSFMVGYSFEHKKTEEIIEVFIDTDSDGVSDEEDDCPKTPGPADNNGCPVLTVEQEAVVDTAFANLEFVFSKAEITFDSYKSLTRLGSMLMENPDMRLRIEGHTDNVGGDSMNIMLSKARSNSVKVFLTDRGVDPKTIMTFYYGEQKPIATNNTEEGRAKNRRVELTIYFE